jgi:hypothetical protein
MPVDRAWRRIDGFARVQLDDRTALHLGSGNTLFDQDDLTTLVAVPLRAGSGREAEMGDGSVRALFDPGDGTGEIRVWLCVDAPKTRNCERGAEALQAYQSSESGLHDVKTSYGALAARPRPVAAWN